MRLLIATRRVYRRSFIASFIVFGAVLSSVAPASALYFPVTADPATTSIDPNAKDMNVVITWVLPGTDKTKISVADVNITGCGWDTATTLLCNGTNLYQSVPSAGYVYQSGQFSYWTYGPRPAPLPAALPLFATGLGALGLLGWRRKRKAAADIAAA